MIGLVALHAVFGSIGLACGDRLGRRCLLLGAVAPAATFVWLLVQLGGVFDDIPVTESVEWVPALGMNLDLRLDGFGALMVALVAGIGVLVYAYAAVYFPAGRVDLGRLAALLTFFAGSMFGLVVADNLIVLYGFWELTAVTSFLLIGNSHTDGRARAAALQALLITSAGALAMLVGFVVLGQAAGTYRISELLSDPPSGTAVQIALGLILVGAFTKSAQYPTFRWLPGAMVAPTPVQRVPALGDDGQRRRVPDRPTLTGLRRRGVVATRGRLGRAVHHDRRRHAGDASDRPEAAAGDEHRQSARPDGGRVRARLGDLGHGRVRAPARPRAGQGCGVHGRRHARPPVRHARHARPAAPSPGMGPDDGDHAASRPRRWPGCRWSSVSSPRKRSSRRSTKRPDGRRRSRWRRSSPDQRSAWRTASASPWERWAG